MSTQLVYETHSTTLDNEAGIATGWLPGELSEEGRRQAATLGERRRDDGIAAVFVSDLARAVQTARIAFTGSSLAIYEDERLRECNYGDWNGAPVAQVAAERTVRISAPFPNGESYLDVVQRTHEFLHDLSHFWHDARVLLISHSANRWALDHLLNGTPLEELVDAPFDWQPGWEYELPDGWPGYPH
jgi:broad specificity phosphatase PhoE